MSKKTNNTLAEKFFEAWKAEANDWEDKLLEAWNSSRDYTRLVINEHSVIKGTADRLNLCCYPYEYYSLDAVLYQKEHRVPGTEGCWLRDISVAFEHENVYDRNLFQEVAHLLITRCNLRVLVTYSWVDSNGNNILDYLHNIIDGSNAADAINTANSFLMIFGSNKGGAISWEGRIFKKEAWCLLG